MKYLTASAIALVALTACGNAFADEAPCGYLGGCDPVVVPPPPDEPPVYDGPAIGEKVQEAE